MSIFEIGIISFLTGIMASLGLGGGMLLIVYLTIFAGVGQLTAQGINLIFFLPIAAVSLIFHTKNKLVDIKKAAPAIVTGTVCSGIFSLIASQIKPVYLEKAFGVFLVLAGVKILFEKKKQAAR